MGKRAVYTGLIQIAQKAVVNLVHISRRGKKMLTYVSVCANVMAQR